MEMKHGGYRQKTINLNPDISLIILNLNDLNTPINIREFRTALKMTKLHASKEFCVGRLKVQVRGLPWWLSG